MKKSFGKLIAELAEAVRELDGKPEEDVRPLLDSLYTADPRLQSVIDEVAEHVRNPSRESTASIGQKLEQVAYLAFAGLKGYPTILSYRSATSQHDLLVKGDGDVAKALCTLIRVSRKRRGILVECKGTDDKVGDPEFRRLCALLSDHFVKTVAIGVFVTLKGATGFPDPGVAARKIGDARLTQVIYYARTSKPIIVLDWEDLQTLTRPGSLPLLLMRRVEDIEKLGAVTNADCPLCEEVSLPAHLAGFRQ